MKEKTLRPTGLSPAAARYWKLLAPDAIAEGRLGISNLEAFKMLCRTLAICDALDADIGKNGPTLKGLSGGAKANPSVALLLQANEAAKDLLHTFSFTCAFEVGNFRK